MLFLLPAAPAYAHAALLRSSPAAGTTVPKALNLVRLGPVRAVRAHYHQQSVTDVTWLTDVGRQGWLAFSCNKRILTVQEERETIIREQVGIVFLTSGQEYAASVLRLVLNRWQWLEDIDQHVPRPFVFYLYPNGRRKQIQL